MTGTGLLIGTPGYVAPEVVIEGTLDDPRSDLYAVGVTWFELLTGSAPFTAKTPMALALVHAHEAAPSPSSRLPFSPVPAPVESLVMALLAKQPSQRPPSARALVDANDALMTQARAAASETPLPSLGPNESTIADDVAATGAMPVGPGLARATPLSATPALPAPATPSPATRPTPLSMSSVPQATPGPPMALAETATTTRPAWRAAAAGFVVALVCVGGLLALVGRDGGAVVDPNTRAALNPPNDPLAPPALPSPPPSQPDVVPPTTPTPPTPVAIVTSIAPPVVPQPPRPPRRPPPSCRPHRPSRPRQRCALRPSCSAAR